MTDRELILGCIREERDCQLEVFRRYSGKMLSVCLRYSRHHMEAEDILQDAFIKVFDNIDKFQHKGSFEGWIRRIVVNTALKNYQKSSYKKERIGLETYEDQPLAPEALSTLSEQELLKLISKLPDGYRQVFNLYVIEGYSHKEIAEMLSIGESTSRSQLVKARNILKTQVLKMQTILL